VSTSVSFRLCKGYGVHISELQTMTFRVMTLCRLHGRSSHGSTPKCW